MFCISTEVGRLVFWRFYRFLPYVGWLTIIMTEKPFIKVRVLHINSSPLLVYKYCRKSSLQYGLVTVADFCFVAARYYMNMTFESFVSTFLQYILIGALGLLVITSKD